MWCSDFQATLKSCWRKLAPSAVAVRRECSAVAVCRETWACYSILFLSLWNQLPSDAQLWTVRVDLRCWEQLQLLSSKDFLLLDRVEDRQEEMQLTLSCLSSQTCPLPAGFLLKRYTIYTVFASSTCWGKEKQLVLKGKWLEKKGFNKHAFFLPFTHTHTQTRSSSIQFKPTHSCFAWKKCPWGK